MRVWVNDLARALLSGLRAEAGLRDPRIGGGLGHVNIMTSVFFAGTSGTAVADAASLSNTLVPAMEERGYTKLYARDHGNLGRGAVRGGYPVGTFARLRSFCAQCLLRRARRSPRIERGEAPSVLPAIGRALPALLLPRLDSFHDQFRGFVIRKQDCLAIHHSLFSYKKAAQISGFAPYGFLALPPT